ncbi:MAG: HAMP domain-containing histidine kinase [Campylobacteraceae bacterium]|nr:HAMP domain-containing histidine kinase [Campylobacteraceae bacterium]
MIDFIILNKFYFFIVFSFLILLLFFYLSKRKVEKKYKLHLEKEIREQILELRKKDELLIAQSKLAAVGETLAHIAHQWKQPLNQINSVVLKIETDYDDKVLNQELLEEHLNEIEKLTFYMSDTITSFNNYLQPNDKKEIFSIKNAFDDAYELVYKLLESKRIESKVVIINDSLVKGVKKEFVQALLVILNNAKDILEERNIKKRKISINIFSKENKAYINIEDNAGGIENKYFKKIFDPYFTTKPHSQGTGHGLCMAKMIVEKSMLGELLVTNQNAGAMFSIKLNKMEEYE